MNEELTRDVLEAMAGCEGGCSLCEAREVCLGNRYKQFNILAAALIEEKAKPNVWDGAPEPATITDVYWSDEVGWAHGSKRFTRELPKTRARQIAEEIDAALEAPRYTPRIEVIEKLLNKYAEELEGKE